MLAKSSSTIGGHTKRTMSGTCYRLAVCAPSSTPQGPRVNTAELPSRPPDSIPSSVQCFRRSGRRSVSCISNFKLTGMALEQLQEVFGSLVTEQLNSMEWAPTKREAERSKARGARGSRPPQTDHPGAKVGEISPHDPPLSCHQTTGRQHDGGNNLPARHLESNQGPHHGLGVHGGPDGSISTTDHRASAPPGHTQAVAGCRACPTSTGRILLIRLLNSSNTCYINASVRAWLFAVSHLQVADILKYGTQEQAWRESLQRT